MNAAAINAELRAALVELMQLCHDQYVIRASNGSEIVHPTYERARAAVAAANAADARQQDRLREACFDMAEELKELQR